MIAVGVLLLLGVGVIQIAQSVRRPAQSTPSGPAAADGLTTDQGRTRWGVGEWEQTDGNERLEYRFESVDSIG